MLLQKVLLVFLGILVLSGTNPARANLITNGSFGKGNTEFSSDYGYWNPEEHPTENQDEGYYSVEGNPKDVHGKWPVMGDHTTGTGLMLLVNGGEDPTDAVWKQSVNLNAGVTYKFSAWATGIYSEYYPQYPALLDFRIDEVSLGQMEPDAAEEGGSIPAWQQFDTTFEVDPSRIATLAVYDLRMDRLGNDFALDDISLVPEPSSLVLGGIFFSGIILWWWRKRRK